MNLFSTFDRASEAIIADPGLLYEVHGVAREVPLSEAKSIAYLGMLLDGFHHFYGHLHGGDYSRMQSDLKTKSIFLNRLLALPANQTRWNSIRQIYYGDSDVGFMEAIEAIIDHERQKSVR